ncbi:MAG: gfo/Idh/MocA family oxidoreductase [Caldilinea sp. CFX5]|nr:gfo/Idh/MocA family oxidoreductase [Caldilinea sp. CFX5]
MNNKCRIAIVGAGVIGQKHAGLVRASAVAELVGICDSDGSRVQVAHEFQVPFYQKLEELLITQRPAGVIVATPNHLHAPVAEVCVAHGVHLLVEKPIADSLADAERINRAAQQAGVQVLVGHHRRHNPLIAQTRTLIQQGALGKLIGVSVLWTIRKPDDYFDVTWRTQRPNGGPALINLIHEIDSLRFICGEITQVYAQSSAAVRGFAVEDSLTATLTFANGAFGSILLSDAAAAPWSYEATTGENPLYFRADEDCYHFVGTTGALAFPTMQLWHYADPSRVGWQHPMTSSRVTVENADPLVRQLEHFCRVIQGEEAPFVSAAEGTRSLAVILALLEAAESNRAVVL